MEQLFNKYIHGKNCICQTKSNYFIDTIRNNIAFGVDDENISDEKIIKV